MQMKPWEKSLVNGLAELTGTCAGDWFLTYRCRHGMLAVLKALRSVAGGGKILTQLFTCCTAVNPILAAGFDPIYGDVSIETCSLDPELLQIGPDVRAVMLQHTFGIIDQETSQKVAMAARSAGALVLEDSAHCVGRMARDEDGLPVADVSFFSFGVEKMLPTVFGGAVWVNPASGFSDVMRAVREALSALPVPENHYEWLNASYRGTNRLLVHLPSVLSRPLRGALTSLGAFDPAVSARERLGAVGQEPMRATKFACEAALAAIEGCSSMIENRRTIVEMYRDLLSNVDDVVIPAAVMVGEAQPLLRFPAILINEGLADAAEHAITDAGYYTTAWYRPELGPGVLDPTVYNVPNERSGLRANDRLVAGIVNLPTDISINAVPRVVSAFLSVFNEAPV